MSLVNQRDSQKNKGDLEKEFQGVPSANVMTQVPEKVVMARSAKPFRFKTGSLSQLHPNLGTTATLCPCVR